MPRAGAHHLAVVQPRHAGRGSARHRDLDADHLAQLEQQAFLVLPGQADGRGCFEPEPRLADRVARPVCGGALDLALVGQRRLVDDEGAGDGGALAVRDDARPPSGEHLQAVLEPGDLWRGGTRHPHRQLHLLVLEGHRVLQLLGEVRRRGHALGQGDGERLGHGRRVRAARAVLGKHPELVAPARLEPRQRELAAGHHAGGGAHPVRGARAPVLHQVARNGGASIADGWVPADSDDVILRPGAGGHQQRLSGRMRPLCLLPVHVLLTAGAGVSVVFRILFGRLVAHVTALRRRPPGLAGSKEWLAVVAHAAAAPRLRPPPGLVTRSWSWRARLAPARPPARVHA